MTKNKDYDYIFKLVLIGDTCVGKSCILVRFSDDIFNDNYVTTIGVDFRFKTMVVKNKVTKIQIWDTAGQERYRSITTAYYRGAAAIIICCDCTNNESFINVKNWIEEIGKYKGDAGMSIRDRDREASVIANALNFSEPPYDKYVGSVFESIINSAVDLQNDGRK